MTCGARSHKPTFCGALEEFGMDRCSGVRLQVYVLLLECMQQYNCDGTQLQRPLSWKVLHLSALAKVAASEHLDDFSHDLHYRVPDANFT